VSNIMSESIPAGLVEYLNGATDRRLSSWAWNLCDWGRRTQLLAVLAVAEASLSVWERGVPDDPNWPLAPDETAAACKGLSTLRDWLRSSDESLLDTLYSQAVEHSRSFRVVEFHADEAPGPGELVRQRERCMWAGAAIAWAFSAALWTDEDAPRSPEEAEQRAMIAAGPAQRVSDAVVAFRSCFREKSEAEVRALVRSGILEPRL
jgi:hypothetical protein